MSIRRTWPGPGGNNLSLDVQRLGDRGYEFRDWGNWRKLGDEPGRPATSFISGDYQRYIVENSIFSEKTAITL